MPPAAELLSLALSAFTSATLLPGTSEPALLLFGARHPDRLAAAWLTASAANTLGSLCSYLIARRLPDRIAQQKIPPRLLNRVRRHGAAALLFSWLPVVGDALPLAAGWLRLPFYPCLIATAVGKSLRYAFILWVGHQTGLFTT